MFNTLAAETRFAFDIEVETPKFLVPVEEGELARKALAQQPSSPRLRRNLALSLFDLDQNDEAIEILTRLAEEENADFRVFCTLALALLARETRDDTLRAKAAALEAVAQAESAAQKGHALASLGKAEIRLGQDNDARESLSAALAAAPGNRDAYKRLAALEGRTKTPESVIALSASMIAKGVAHPPVLMSRAVALTTLGRFDEARELIGLEPFLYRRLLAAPPGFPDVTTFNAALADELLNHPGLRSSRYGVASTKSWRVDQPATRRSRYMPLLQQAIVQEIAGHVAALDDRHPWVKARPERALLHNWCVITGQEGYEEWHVIQHGWMSGVYYVDVPQVVTAGSSEGGCLVFGIPSDRVGAEAAEAFGETVIRPFGGLLLLFPSHAFHRTFPHGSDRHRICIAFDVVPR